MLEFTKNIILTGAGFTANFGGFLAKEMWSKIFNNPLLDSSPTIKEALRNNFDFEKIYSGVITGSNTYPAAELNKYKEVVKDSYEVMNDFLIDPDLTLITDPIKVKEFMEAFMHKSEDAIGGYFTLNQDMFPEIKYNWQPLGPKVSESIRPNTTVTLPTKEEVDTYLSELDGGNLCYIKLHGSVNWFQTDGNSTMVIGINKEEAIKNVPILNTYFDLFKQAINRDGVKLLVIGYGFLDEHINKCLIDAIRNHGLQLYIISSEDPQRFKNKLTIKGSHETYNGMLTEENDEGKIIWGAVRKYFPYKLSQIFPSAVARTAEQDEVLSII